MYRSRFPVFIVLQRNMTLPDGTSRTVGFAGQQPPSAKEATLPNAAASFQPAQVDWQVTASYEIFQTPKSWRLSQSK